MALYMIIAWRIPKTWSCLTAYPDLPCNVVFDDLEWRTAFVIRHHRPPTTPPRLADMIAVVVSSAAILARKSDPPPGPKAIWIGLGVCGILLSREQPSIKSTEFVWNDVGSTVSAKISIKRRSNSTGLARVGGRSSR